MFNIIKNKDKALCCAYRCKNGRPKKDRFCPKHRHRFQKFNDQEAYTYNLLKSNANKRNIECPITLEEFREFCAETNYIELKGTTGESASIDRKDPSIGYTKSNMQILSLANNSKKMHEDNKEDLPF